MNNNCPGALEFGTAVVGEPEQLELSYHLTKLLDSSGILDPDV